MRIKCCLLLLLLFCAGWPARLAAAQETHDCIILLQGDPALLNRQGEKLHMLIDLLPANYRLGLAFCGQSGLMVPSELTLDRRAELHAVLQAGLNQKQATEREFQQLVVSALQQLGSGQAGSHTLLLVPAAGQSDDSWQAQSARLSSSRVQVLALSESALSQHPLVQLSAGQQIVMDSTLLPSLLQQLGLGSGLLSQAAIAQDSAELSWQLDQEVEGFVLLVERALPATVTVTTPAGQRWSLEQASTGIACLSTPGYTCLHVERELVAAELQWNGDWRVSVPAQAGVALWLIDPVRVDGQVTTAANGRVVTASVWRGGERMTKESFGDGEMTLRDSAPDSLLVLNDLGLNGDQQAGDGVWSGLLPDYRHPLGGAVSLEVRGYVYRSLRLQLPPASQLVPRAGANRESLLLGMLAALIGVFGLLVLIRPRPAAWRLSHRSAAGYSRSLRHGPRPVYAGSGRGCPLRLSASAGHRHLRFQPGPGSLLSLEVLHPEPVTLVNGEQVYLRRELQHGDQVQIGDDQITVERLAALRVGRRTH